MRKLFLLGLASLFWCNSTASGETPTNGQVPSNVRPRAIFVLWDVTPSYPSRQIAAEKIGEIVKALGPGDRFYLIEIGGEFSPEESVKIQCKMPVLDPLLLQPTFASAIWQAHQKELQQLWQRVHDIQGKVAAYVSTRIKEKNPTPLYEALRYASKRLIGEEDAERYLYIFSDLEQDSNGLRSSMPPKGEPYPVSRVEAFALFVPWGKNWENRKVAWTDWYVKSCGAAHFKMLDVSESKLFVPLDKNRTPVFVPPLGGVQ